MCFIVFVLAALKKSFEGYMRCPLTYLRLFYNSNYPLPRIWQKTSRTPPPSRLSTGVHKWLPNKLPSFRFSFRSINKYWVFKYTFFSTSQLNIVKPHLSINGEKTVDFVQREMSFSDQSFSKFVLLFSQDSSNFCHFVLFF